MAEWTRDMVEERVTEAAAVLKQAARAAVAGLLQHLAGDPAEPRRRSREGMPRPMRLPPPSTAAITRMEEAITWNQLPRAR